MSTLRRDTQYSVAGQAGHGARQSDIDIEDYNRRQKETDSSWDEEWDLGNMPMKWRLVCGIFLLLIVVMLVIVLPVIYSTSSRVDADHVGVIVYHNGEISGDPADPGRRFHGVGGKVALFPRFDATIEYAGNNPISVRVRDGQMIQLDLSFQYSTPKDNLVDIYRVHRDGFAATLRTIARDTLHNQAAQYTALAFFSNRTMIAQQMRERMEIEGRSRLILITGFQIRGVRLPAALTDNLFNVQSQQLNIRAREAVLILEQIDANTNALELSLRTARLRGLAEFDQSTAVILAREAQNTSRINEETQQLLAQVRGTTNQTVTIYEQVTQGMVEEIRQNITIETETTRREVDRLQHESETNLTIFAQETQNVQLGYDNQVTLINEETRQEVAGINANTTEQVAAFEARLRLASAAAQLRRRVLLASAQEGATNATISAQGEAYSGLPSAVYLAETVANGTLAHTQFYDTNMTELVDIAIGTPGAIP
mmetsp:Transcript_33081/g.86513  ORF Transcript_33081/g.86513 Transcript_33081/m.86513 type:complete len:484 (-) Transcript_33081:164-1615(-)